MSYDIRFKVRERETGQWVTLDETGANITYNVGGLIRASTGLKWANNEDNGYVKDVILNIKRGFDELTYYPEKYIKYESPNGWGTVEGTRSFFADILNAWRWLNMDVSPELANVAKFWIE